MKGIVAYAAQSYLQLIRAERRVEKIRDELKKTLKALSRAEVQDYARLTAEIDKKEEAKCQK
jgi:hypothetical protein